MTITYRGLAAAALVLALAACRSRGGEEAATTTPAETAPPAETTGAAPMPGMPGPGGMPGMPGGSMMATMQSHMRMMQGMGADSMKAMLPQHRQMVANMLAQMNQEMRRMNMAQDPAWTATVDSIRQDLTTMPSMSASELHAFMPRHGARVMRLVEMHQRMMREG